MISTAWAHNITLNESSGGGGGTALLIILGVALTFLLLYLGHRKWRERRPARHGGDREARGAAQR